MSNEPLSSGISPLDAAHAKWIDGDREAATRGTLAILEASSDHHGAALLCCQLLIDAERPDLAGEVARRLVDAFIRRGDAPMATVAALVARQAGEEFVPLCDQIAAAFSANSDRLSDVSPTPPPLSRAPSAPPSLSGLRGSALLDRAEKALIGFLSSDDEVPADAKLPALPLFSALSRSRLSTFLQHLRLVEKGTDAEIVRQGDEGREAFVLARGVLRVSRRVGSEDRLLAVLGPGSILGEMALVSDAPRAASVSAVEPVQLLAIERADLERLAASDPAVGRELGEFCRARMVANLVRHSAVLRAVPVSDRESVIGRFEARTFEPGEAVLDHGGEVGGLFLVASGGVEVRGRDGDGDPIVVAALGPGDVVGEMSLVLRRPASADVIARYPTVALELSRDAFQQAIREYPALLNELYDLAAKRDEEMQTVVAQEALDVEDVVLL